MFLNENGYHYTIVGFNAIAVFPSKLGPEYAAYIYISDNPINSFEFTDVIAQHQHAMKYGRGWDKELTKEAIEMVQLFMNKRFNPDKRKMVKPNVR